MELALEGITSFSTFPLRMWTYIGLVVAGLAFIYGAWMIVDTLAFGNAVRGYPSLLVSILFLGGIQLIGIGVLGEYIGRIYIEVKKTALYFKGCKINERFFKILFIFLLAICFLIVISPVLHDGIWAGFDWQAHTLRFSSIKHSLANEQFPRPLIIGQIRSTRIRGAYFTHLLAICIS